MDWAGFEPIQVWTCYKQVNLVVPKEALGQGKSVKIYGEVLSKIA